MKNLLTFTTLDKTYNNHEVKGRIALYSIHVEIQKTIPNTFNLKVDGLVVYLKIGERAATNLTLPVLGGGGGGGLLGPRPYTFTDKKKCTCRIFLKFYDFS